MEQRMVMQQYLYNILHFELQKIKHIPQFKILKALVDALWNISN